MSGYGYAPPPPPPSASAGHAGYRASSASYPHHTSGRGGGQSGGRGRGGGQYPSGRGDYHAAPQTHYEYAAQPYQHVNPPAYPLPHQPPSTYPLPHAQWPHEAGHHPPPHHVHSHAPSPITSTNYHPNYVPQTYPPSSYPAQPSYGQPQQYGHPYQAPPPSNPPQWAGQGHVSQQPQRSNRGRGAFSDVGGAKHHTGAPVHQGYEHELVPPPVNGTYGHQPYAQGPRSAHYQPPQYAYSAPPPPPTSSRQDGYSSQNFRRGRGGGHRDAGGRGRGGHFGDKSRDHKSNQHKGSQKHAKAESKQPSLPQQPQQPHPSVGKKKKRKMNTLGLTPGMDSASEDDEGEEKALEELIGTEALEITDMTAYLEERRKNFPTKARIEAKKVAELAQQGEDKASSLEKKADKLRRQLRKVESTIKRKREQGDEGDDMRDPSDDSSDDDKPEVMSSRSQAAPPPPPAKKADVSRHCKYYATGGTCGKKGKCRFVHDPEVREEAMKEREANNGRITIQQRLILNEKEQDDLAILQSIQYLRGKGLMTPANSVEVKKEGHNEEKKVAKAAVSGGTSLLPAASPSLPPPPVKREPGSSRHKPPPSVVPNADSISGQGLKHYQGWLLEPYGSANGKACKIDDLP